MKLLYAEDNPQDADLTRAYLAEHAPEIELQVVSTGAACLEQIQRSPPDMLLLDHHLPDIDGVTLLPQLLRHAPSLAVVIVTGVGDEALVERALSLGAAHYVPKHDNYLDTLADLLPKVLTEHRLKLSQGLHARQTPQRILYVEHLPMDIDLTLRHFAEAAPNFVVDVVRTCALARTQLNQSPAYDLVLFALQMPDQNGLDFMREAKYHAQQLPPCIVISGNGSETTALAALQLGATDYVIKRHGYLNELAGRINNAISQAQVSRAHARLEAEIRKRMVMEEALRSNQAELAAQNELLIDQQHDLQVLHAKKAELLQLIIDASPIAMVVVNDAGVITLANQELTNIFDYTKEALVGQPIEVLLPPKNQAAHQHHVPSFFHNTPRRRRMGLGNELFGQSSDGRLVPVEIGLSPFTTDNKTYAIASVIDITSRKQAEHALQAALQEKTALLNEVHHRVKNNLQVITSLLRLEAGRSSQPDTKAVLGDMQGRIRSMSLLHETLYRSGTFASIDLGSYLKQLATQSFRALLTGSGAVQLRLDLASVTVSMDQATPCGLLVNELISNSLKHGFPDGRSGEVRIELQAINGGPQARLRVSDTGVGLSHDFEAKRGNSLGLRLVTDLTKQLGGTVEIGAGPGAEFTVTFMVDELKLTVNNAV